MRYLQSSKGAALVTALMLTMLSLVVALALLYSVTTGTRISASQKRYRSALEAAQGGVELMTREIIPRAFQVELTPGAVSETIESDFSGINLHLPNYPCLQQKMLTVSSTWSACSAEQLSADPVLSPDLTFNLSGSPKEKGFTISSKIIDTVPGNSDTSPVDYLDTGGSVASRDESIRPRHTPSLFNIAVLGVRDGGSGERARLSVLYAY